MFAVLEHHLSRGDAQRAASEQMYESSAGVNRWKRGTSDGSSVRNITITILMEKKGKIAHAFAHL